jgi:hypothetical protein
MAVVEGTSCALALLSLPAPTARLDDFTHQLGRETLARMTAQARWPATAAAILIVCSLSTSVARADPMITADAVLGAGSSLSHAPVRFNYGLYASLLFGPPPTDSHITVPVGFYLLGEGDSNGNSFGSIGLSAAVLGVPSSELTPITLSVGPIGGERNDGQSHPGMLVRGAWGLWGAQDWTFKALSLQLFVEDRVMFADQNLPTDHQIVFGLQMSPAMPLVTAIAVATLGSGYR